MDLTLVAGSLAVGFGAGVLSGAFGVGGAVLTTPGIRAFGVSPIQAVGSTIPAILPAALSGAYRYSRAGMLDRRVGLTCGVTGAAMAVAGSKTSDLVDARWLMVATAGLLLWSGISSIHKGYSAPRAVGERAAARAELRVQPTPIALTESGPTDQTEQPETRKTPSTPTLMLVGALAGFVAGVLGVGGGVIMMPLFTNVLRIPVKIAVGSSLVAVAIFSVPAMIAHSFLGHIEWTVALLLTVGTVPGASLGSRLAIGSSDRTMYLVLGVFFCILAIVFGGRELAAMY